MLPRSTACRHGDGRTWTKATSISGGGARGGVEADRLDLGYVEPELVVHGLPDRLAPLTRHINVRGAAAPVRDRECLVWREETECGDRDGHGEGRAEQHIA